MRFKNELNFFLINDNVKQKKFEKQLKTIKNFELNNFDVVKNVIKSFFIMCFLKTRFAFFKYISFNFLLKEIQRTKKKLTVKKKLQLKDEK